MQAIVLTAVVAADRPELGVGWMPTEAEQAAKALEWASVGSGDFFYELGCGDGRVAIEAARRGAKAVCVEKDMSMLAIARTEVERAGMSALVELRSADVFEVDLSAATVVYTFLLPWMNARLVPSLERMPAGARVITRESQFLGWPCGQRLALPGVLFLKWKLPVTRVTLPPSAFDEAHEIEHLLDCAAEDAAPAVCAENGECRSH